MEGTREKGVQSTLEGGGGANGALKNVFHLFKRRRGRNVEGEVKAEKKGFIRPSRGVVENGGKGWGETGKMNRSISMRFQSLP